MYNNVPIQNQSMKLPIRNTKFLLALILILAAVLRLYKCDFQNLWLDEVLTMNSANPKLSLKQFFRSVMFWEYIPHLYYFLNRLIFDVFGYTSLAARLFSAIIGIIGVYAIYLLGKELFSKKAGLVAATLLAVNIYHISYSQEIRPYGMLFLFTTLSIYRLAVFIKVPSIKNAVYYGIFTGLILNAHFFGLITIFSQSLILLYFLSLKPKAERAHFFKNMLISAGVALLLALPATEPFIRVFKIESFWMTKPDASVYTAMFREFFGQSEMLLFTLNSVVLYYMFRIFGQKHQRYDFAFIAGNKNVFSFIFLLVWLSISLILPLIKSYLGASMMVTRYFISVLAALIITISIGVVLIKNRLLQLTVLFTIVSLSLIHLFVVTDYYNKITKTQYKELAAELKEDNSQMSTIVTFYSWILPYYFSDLPEQQIINNTLEQQVEGIKEGKLPTTPFWYVDFNGRPYELSVQGQEYLDANFITVKKLNQYDIWANYYVPKSYKGMGKQPDGSEYVFLGTKVFLENGVFKSKKISLEKGLYNLKISGVSTPEVPVKGENAHFTVKFAGNVIGKVYLSEKPEKPEKTISFTCLKSSKGRIELIYDNDIYENNQDRNATLYSVKINKIE